jgi:hypothetical protein
MTRSRTTRAAAAAALLALPLAACSTSKETRACPRVEVLGDAANLTRFREGEGRDLTDVRYSATIRNASGTCSYDRDGVTVTTTVVIVGEKGPAFADGPADVEYFVAVADPNRRILNEEKFASRLEFQDNQQRTGVREEVDERIPLPKDATAERYVIIVGFGLSPAELDYNRKQRGL